MSQIVLVYTTWPDLQSAHAFAETAVGEGLAACANILGSMASIYRWKGVVEQAQETPMLLKTSSHRIAELRARFLENHPYETPAFVAWALERDFSHAPFLDWVEQEAAVKPAGV